MVPMWMCPKTIADVTTVVETSVVLTQRHPLHSGDRWLLCAKVYLKNYLKDYRLYVNLIKHLQNHPVTSHTLIQRVVINLTLRTFQFQKHIVRILCPHTARRGITWFIIWTASDRHFLPITIFFIDWVVLISCQLIRPCYSFCGV